MKEMDLMIIDVCIANEEQDWIWL